MLGSWYLFIYIRIVCTLTKSTGQGSLHFSTPPHPSSTLRHMFDPSLGSLHKRRSSSTSKTNSREKKIKTRFSPRKFSKKSPSSLRNRFRSLQALLRRRRCTSSRARRSRYTAFMVKHPHEGIPKLVLENEEDW